MRQVVLEVLVPGAGVVVLHPPPRMERVRTVLVVTFTTIRNCYEVLIKDGKNQRANFHNDFEELEEENHESDEPSY